MSIAAVDYQAFPPLDTATEAALRDSIDRFGVLVPITIDQHGNILDGHHRKRIADELGVSCPRKLRHVESAAEAAEIAVTLNLARRHLDRGQRVAVEAHLREQGHSFRAIAAALGVSKSQVADDLGALSETGQWSPPETINTTDGRQYPATRPEKPDAVDIADRIREQEPDADHDVNGEAEAIANTASEDDVDEKINDAVESRKTSKPPITKPNLGGGVSHPARYSDELIPWFVEFLDGYVSVLDPFAGTGRIHELREYGHTTVGVEIEPEWAAMHEGTVEGDALKLKFVAGQFDAICTSPTYGNRLADKHNASDPELRRSYTHDLGRELHEHNSGAMQWGAEYKAFHRKAWKQAVRVLRPGGRFVLNIKDHIRDGKRQPVSRFHIETLVDLGLVYIDEVPVSTTSLRQGTNRELRITAERVIAFDKPGAS